MPRAARATSRASSAAAARRRSAVGAVTYALGGLRLSPPPAKVPYELPSLRLAAAGDAVGSVFGSASEWVTSEWDALGEELGDAGLELPALGDPDEPADAPQRPPRADERGGGMPLWAVLAVAAGALAALFAGTTAAAALECRPASAEERYGRRGAIRRWWREICELEALERRLFLRRGGAPGCASLQRNAARPRARGG